MGLSVRVRLEPADAIGLGVEERGARPRASRRPACPWPGAIDRPSMLWPAAMITLSRAGLRSMIGRLSYVIGRQPYHSPRSARTRARAGRAAPSLEKLEPLGFDRRVVAGELHGRAEPIAGLKRRDGHAGLGEDQADLGADRRAAAWSGCSPCPAGSAPGSRAGRSRAASRRRWRRRTRRRRVPSCSVSAATARPFLRRKPRNPQFSRIATPRCFEHACRQERISLSGRRWASSW